MMKNKIVLLAMLGVLTAFATIINNMYLPALPKLVEFFGATITQVQLGLTAGMVGLTIGSLVIGPLSDRLGRRGPLLVSMLVFTLASVGIIYAPGINAFVALRFLQGFAGGGGVVIARSIATDNYREHALLVALAVINVINGIAPIVMPIVGGSIVEAANWQGIFAFMAVVGLVMLVACALMREALPEAARNKGGVMDVCRQFVKVLGNKEYVCYIVHQGAAQMLLFGNIASSSYIVQERYGFSPIAYSLTLGVNGLFIAIGAGAAGALKSSLRGVMVSSWGMIVFALLELALVQFDLNFWAYEGVLCVMLAFMGITLTSSSSLAMESERLYAGTASALLGTLGFLAGSVVSPLVGIGTDMLLTTAVIFVLGAALAFAFGHKAMALTAKK